MFISRLINDDLIDLRNKFVAAGFDLRFVGGCVRDVLANMHPKDIDLCTDATPDEQIQIYKQHNIRYIETGLQHGTVSVVLDSVVYEITSLRIDAETDGRHASVVYTRDWLVDLQRRDFTINAMSLTFDGELIDPFNGYVDLQNQLVRFVGNPADRIREDYLRILRWFRFRGRFGMNKTAEDSAAVEVNFVFGLGAISRERVWSEISKILSGDHGPQLMLEMSLMGISACIDIPIKPSINSVELACAVHEFNRDSVTLLVALYGQWAEKILINWKASSNEITKAKWLWVHLPHFRPPSYYMANNSTSGEWAANLAALRGEDRFTQEVLRAWKPPAFPVSGHDLMQLGIQPGPDMGMYLSILRSKWAESKCLLEKTDLLEIAVDEKLKRVKQ